MKNAPMLCVRCCVRCTWPGDFPNSMLAICRTCVNEEDEIHASFSFVVAGTVLVAVLFVVGAVTYFFMQ